MVLELRPAHDPTKAHGFVGVVTSLADLSASVWVWYLEGGQWAVKKVIEIPAEPAEAEQLPPVIQPFKAVPPLVTDINLSLDDQWLYVSCWGTGELRRYDVSVPDRPKLASVIQIGGIVRRQGLDGSGPLNGGPQMVELSRDGKRVYLTNSLYAAWDEQFYPEGLKSWFVKLEAGADGGLKAEEGFFLETEQRAHQIHLEGGDASSDSYCYP